MATKFSTHIDDYSYFIPPYQGSGVVVTSDNSTDAVRYEDFSITPNVPSILDIPEGQQIRIGDDFIISGKELKTCLNVLRKIVAKEYPEELI